MHLLSFGGTNFGKLVGEGRSKKIGVITIGGSREGEEKGGTEWLMHFYL